MLLIKIILIFQKLPNADLVLGMRNIDTINKISAFSKHFFLPVTFKNIDVTKKHRCCN